MDATRELLDYQSDQIERVLASYGVPGRVYGGAVSPRLVEFHVAPAAGVKIARIERLAEELAMYLGVSSCRVQRRGAVVSIEVVKEHPPTVRLLSLLHGLGESVPAATAVLGQDNEGLPILLRLPSPDVAHVLIAGTTGSGKTELAKSMILSLALCNQPSAVRLLLVDPKGRGYSAFAPLVQHLVCPVVTDVEEAHERLAGLASEMERRDRAGQSEPRIIVFVDELADLMMVGGKRMVQVMTRLSQRGREAGIHLVVSTQKPTAAIVGGLVKSNFPARLVGSVASSDDARVAAGIGGIGAEKLGGRGDFLLVVKGDVRRLQAAYVSQDDLRVAVERLAAQQRGIATGVLPPASAGRALAPEREAAPAATPQVTVPEPPQAGQLTRACAPCGDNDKIPQEATCEHENVPFLGTTGQADDPFLWRPINANLRLGCRPPAPAARIPTSSEETR